MNLKQNKMLDPLGQAWQNGSDSAAQTAGSATVNKHRLCGSLYTTISTMLDPKGIYFDSGSLE